MNLLALAGSSYENTARGILYVIYEMIWKLMYHVLTLVDEVCKLFYRVAGISVTDGVVENRNILDQLLNQNVIGGWYFIFIAIASALVIVFTLVAVIKAMASSDEKRSMGPILKNVGLALLLLVVLGPLLLFFISFVSNVAILIASFGGNESISLADILFNNSGNLLTVYNETYGSEAASFRELGNDFLYDLLHNPKEGVSSLTFYWYIGLLGGTFVLYNLICIVIEVVKRILNIVLLYLGSPFAISKFALDEGKSFKEWQNKFFYEFVLLLAQITTFMIFVALVNVLNNLDFEALVAEAPETGDDSIIDTGIFEPEVEEEPEVVVQEFTLLNGIGRTLIMMAAISVTRSSATMFADLLSQKETKSENILEGLLNRMSNKPATRTRTITKNTTTTKTETVFVEKTPIGGSIDSKSNGNKGNTIVTNNISSTVSVNNKFNSNNMLNRNVNETVKKGSYSGDMPKPGNIYINANRSTEPVQGSTSFKFLDKMATKTAATVAQEYTKANSELSSAIQSGDQTNIKRSLDAYTKAYSKEAEVLSKNYRQFEMRASESMKSEVSNQTKQELKNISASYRKAQMDYSKTADKLRQYSGERMSTAEALRIKEQADKQRETLMNASNKAAQFYENQKKGE